MSPTCHCATRRKEERRHDTLSLSLGVSFSVTIGVSTVGCRRELPLKRSGFCGRLGHGFSFLSWQQQRHPVASICLQRHQRYRDYKTNTREHTSFFLNRSFIDATLLNILKTFRIKFVIIFNYNFFAIMQFISELR